MKIKPLILALLASNCDTNVRAQDEPVPIIPDIQVELMSESMKLGMLDVIKTQRSLDIPDVFQGIGKVQEDPNDWLNLLNLEDEDTLAGDVLKCGLYSLEKHNLIEFAQLLERYFQDEGWQQRMLSDDIQDVKNAIAEASDPYARELYDQSGYKFVQTMPDEMIDWLKNTATMIISGDLFLDPSDEVEPPYVCPEKKCPPCPYVVCPPPKQLINWIQEPEKEPNYIIAKHDIKVKNVTNFDTDSNRAQLEKVFNDGDIMKKTYSKISQDSIVFKDNYVVLELGEKSIVMDSNENKTTITMTDNANFKENPFKGLSQKSASIRGPVSYKKVYSKPTQEKSYSLWNHNSVVYKYSTATNENQENKKKFTWNWDFFKFNWGGQGLRQKEQKWNWKLW